jgi:methyl-accepting chemotaxis protein
MQRRFVVFSSILFLFIFIFGNVTFVVLMSKSYYKNVKYELMQTIEVKRLKLEAYVHSEIAIALKMAGSPLIKRYFLNPADRELQKIAFEEIVEYRKAFIGKNVFWINDIDKKYYFGDEYAYTLDTTEESSWWYNELMKQNDPYSLTVNFDVGIKKIMLWIDAPVFDNNQKPIGIVGTGVNLSDIINTMYHDYSGTEELYFFNAAGEITEAREIDLVENKVNITKVLGKTGEEILARTKKLKDREIEYFGAKEKQKLKGKKQKTRDKRQIVAVSSVPALNWYITAVYPTSIGDFLQTGMTVLFGIMMATVFAVFVIFNLFVVEMLGPFNRMVKRINQTLFDWELKSHEDGHHRDEIRTLSEFLNMAIIDQLTGIYNRRYMDGHLKKIIRSLARTENRSNLSLLLVDVDYFKRYNDTYGHAAGDNCLRIVAFALSQCVSRDIDFVARYGGEEFAVVLPNTDKNGAQIIAEKLLKKIRECNIPHKASDIADHVTISIGGTSGVVDYSQYAQDYIKAADRALYESKRNGRNRYTFGNFEA